MDFHSILFQGLNDPQAARDAPDFFHNLNLDQIIQAVTAAWREYALEPFFYAPLKDIDTVIYRQEVMRDLENDALMEIIRSFSRQMSTMRLHFEFAEGSRYKHEKERWFLGAVETYCLAVEGLRQELARTELHSRELVKFRQYLAEYIDSPSFNELASETKNVVSGLSAITYSLTVKYGSISVRPYSGEIDYTTVVESTFEKFRRGAVKSYFTKVAVYSSVNHIQARVLEGVARLCPDHFHALETFRAQHGDYLNATISRFDREIQFYVAYLTFITKFRNAGLSFCYPRLSQSSKEIRWNCTFDMALANNLLDDGGSVVTNDIVLGGPERIFVVSGPNQGGNRHDRSRLIAGETLLTFTFLYVSPDEEKLAKLS
jgi:DNA mismatch repair protein MutS